MLSKVTFYFTVIVSCLVTGGVIFDGKDVDMDNDRMHYKVPVSGSKGRGKIAGPDWWQLGQDDLNKYLSLVPQNGIAKNVIIFVGDGMGITTETAGRFLLAQQSKLPAYEARLSWEDLPYAGLSKTYNTDVQVPDSAGTATAIFCGEKARDGVIGVNQDVVYGDCSTVAGNELKSIVHHSIEAGKWTGIVTSTRITHATPAAAYAHSPNRDWECDYQVPVADRGTCRDIAYQLVHNTENADIRVIMGGGRQYFYRSNETDPEYPTRYGSRQDEHNLVQDWLNKRAADGLLSNQYKYVFDKAGFDTVDPATTNYLLGLFEPSHMQYEVDKDKDGNGEPTLTEMVQKAIQLLSRSSSANGYFLLVEGGRVDHAHHDNNAYRSLNEELELSRAVKKAMDITSESDTLIIVTADHSHAFTFNGYPTIDNDIFGVVNTGNADDEMPYLTLSYANGPGYYDHRILNGTNRLNLTGVATNDPDFKQDAAVPLGSETHGGDDVAIHARGPLAHLLTGVHEQHYIGHVAMYASCVGPNKGHCTTSTPPITSISNKISAQFCLMIGTIITAIFL